MVHISGGVVVLLRYFLMMAGSVFLFSDRTLVVGAFGCGCPGNDGGSGRRRRAGRVHEGQGVSFIHGKADGGNAIEYQ